MWKAIKPVLGEVLTSKKALVMIAGVVVWALAQAGIVATPEQVLPLLGVLASFIVGQGVADIGKPAKKIETAAIKELAASGSSEESSGKN